jgi:hypothetical protein
MQTHTHTQLPRLLGRSLKSPGVAAASLCTAYLLIKFVQYNLLTNNEEMYFVI